MEGRPGVDAVPQRRRRKRWRNAPRRDLSATTATASYGAVAGADTFHPRLLGHILSSAPIESSRVANVYILFFPSSVRLTTNTQSSRRNRLLLASAAPLIQDTICCRTQQHDGCPESVSSGRQKQKYKWRVSCCQHLLPPQTLAQFAHKEDLPACRRTSPSGGHLSTELARDVTSLLVCASDSSFTRLPCSTCTQCSSIQRTEVEEN